MGTLIFKSLQLIHRYTHNSSSPGFLQIIKQLKQYLLFVFLASALSPPPPKKIFQIKKKLPVLDGAVARILYMYVQ